MSARVTAFVLWAAAAACLAYWGLRVGVSAPPLPPSVQPVSTAMVLHGDVRRLFASERVAAAAPQSIEPALASRFKLLGVVAPKAPVGADEPHAVFSSTEGVALIAVDGKPPRPYRIGAPLDNGLVLQSVATRAVNLGPAEGAPAVHLELPLPTPAATGNLPPPPAFAPPPTVAPVHQTAPEVQPGNEPQADTGGEEPAPPAGAAADPENRR